MKKNSKMLFASIGTVMMLMTLFAIIGVASANQVTSWSSDDVTGDEKNSFATNEIVYVAGDVDGAQHEKAVERWSATIYVTYDRDWHDGDSITAVIAPRPFITAGGFGSFAKEVWIPPLTPGHYDIVLDEDQDGKYNDYDAVDGKTDVGFTVLGPIPTSTLTPPPTPTSQPTDYDGDGRVIGDWDDVWRAYQCHAGFSNGCIDVNGNGKIAGDWGDVYTTFCGYAGFGGVI